MKLAKNPMTLSISFIRNKYIFDISEKFYGIHVISFRREDILLLFAIVYKQFLAF